MLTYYCYYYCSYSYTILLIFLIISKPFSVWVSISRAEVEAICQTVAAPVSDGGLQGLCSKAPWRVLRCFWFGVQKIRYPYTLNPEP